ncbi:hypothetical protein MRX96_047020 [Rhipicephalus microplus]
MLTDWAEFRSYAAEPTWGDHCQRPRLVPHSVCFRPRRPLFHGRRQHPPPGFDGLMGAAYLQEQFGLPRTNTGDRCKRPQFSSHSDGPRPRRRFFQSRLQHTLPGFDGLIGVAYLQEQFGFPSTFPWRPRPTLPTELVPYYCVQGPYPVFPLFPLLPP